MTLLIFKPKGSKPTQLYQPDNSLINSKRKGTSTWRSEEGYDLITIKKPKAGTWKIDAFSDPDNRLMVVTDLKLKVADIPPYLMPSQPVTISAELHNRNKKITKNSFSFSSFNSIKALLALLCFKILLINSWIILYTLISKF